MTLTLADALLLALLLVVVIKGVLAKHKNKRSFMHRYFRRVPPKQRIVGQPIDLLRVSPRRCAEVCVERLCGGIDVGPKTWDCALYPENGFTVQKGYNGHLKSFVRR